MNSSSSSRNWVYDVFPSFRGADVRVTFLSHFRKELDRKLITSFKDNEIEKSRSLNPELKQAIKDSRMAVVVFSENYASSVWCLNELLEIVKCKEECGQMVIPVFYGLDPSHVRRQTGQFGKIFEKTCQNQPEDVKNTWREALTSVANILGYHSVSWGNEAKMIEDMANDVLNKLFLTPSNDYEDFVGIEDHIAKMSVLLQLESEQVKMIGLWGSSGIGKTTIARVSFNRLSRHFQGSLFIDRAFVSKSMEVYSKSNPDDYNMKLHLQRNFLSEILGKRDIHIDRLSALGERLKHQKLLIFIDDLDNHVVLDALVGQTQWYGSGSRVIVVTNNKNLLTAHGISAIYEVSLPSEDQALQMLCQSAFKKNYPPKGFEKLALDATRHAGNLPVSLTVLGSSLRGMDKEAWMDMLTRPHDGLEEIQKILANSTISIEPKCLEDRSLINVGCGQLEKHRNLQMTADRIVQARHIVGLETRKFLKDVKDTYYALNENIAIWLEQVSGKKCIRLSAMNLTIIWGNNPEYWQWIQMPEARVAKLVEVCWFDIRGKMSTHALTPGTHYSAFIVFKKGDTCNGFRNLGIEASVGVVGHEASRRVICFDSSIFPRKNIVKPKKRGDGWMEIEIGEFYNEGGLYSDEIEMKVSETKMLRWKRDLIILGIEIRPKKDYRLSFSL